MLNRTVTIEKCTFSLAWVESSKHTRRLYKVVFKVTFTDESIQYLAFTFLSFDFLYSVLKQMATAYELENVEDLYDKQLSGQIMLTTSVLPPNLVFKKFILDNQTQWPYKDATSGYFMIETF